MSSPEQWTHPGPGAGPAAIAAQPTPEQVIAGLRAASEGGVELTQLLTPEGERVESPQFDNYVEDIDFEALRGLYRDLVLVRRADR
jgi:2-oxoisovalerate dehydrogenase E1 component alpha subunit